MVQTITNEHSERVMKINPIRFEEGNKFMLGTFRLNPTEVEKFINDPDTDGNALARLLDSVNKETDTGHKD